MANPPFAPKPNGQFFELNAKYHIDPAASVSDLVDDAHLLLGSALGPLEAFSTEYSTGVDEDAASSFWIALYGLRQALAVVGAAQDRLLAARHKG